MLLGKRANKNVANKTPSADQVEEQPRSPLMGRLDEYTDAAKEALGKAKGAAEAAIDAVQDADAIDEVKEELSKGGRGRIVFFFIIMILNICLGKFIKNVVLQFANLRFQ